MPRIPQAGKVYARGDRRIEVVAVTARRVAIRDLATGIRTHVLHSRFQGPEGFVRVEGKA